MTAARPLRRGLAAIKNAADNVEPAASVQVLYINGLPRCGFSVREVAETWHLPYKRILAEIDAGRLRAIKGGRDYVIPVSELAVIASWANYGGPHA
jgi:hypothetical protein